MFRVLVFIAAVFFFQLASLPQPTPGELHGPKKRFVNLAREVVPLTASSKNTTPVADDETTLRQPLVGDDTTLRQVSPHLSCAPDSGW